MFLQVSWLPTSVAVLTFVFVSTLALNGHATLPGDKCKTFAEIGRSIQVPGPAGKVIPAPFSAIQSLEELSVIVAARRKEFAASNPGANPNNFSMPENAPAVEYMKASLQNIDRDPYFAFRDNASKALIQKPRTDAVNALLARAAKLERDGYPQIDTFRFADDFASFFDLVDAPVPPWTDVFEALKRAYPQATGFDVSSASVDFKVLTLNLVRMSSKATGQDRLVLEKEHFDSLVVAVKKFFSTNKIEADAVEFIRRLQYSNGFVPDSTKSLIDQAGARNVLGNGKPFVLAAGDLSVRQLAEATFYDVQIGGVIDRPQFVDGNLSKAKTFLNHDILHSVETHEDKIAKKLIDWSPEKKRALLTKIDQIQNPRHRVLAETALLAALREGAGFWFVRSKTESVVMKEIEFLRAIYRNFYRESLSLEEATWMRNWWLENLPKS